MSYELGKRIEHSLLKLNMKQKELADCIGVSEAVVSRYISGERDPKPSILANIATALQTTSDYLLGIEQDDFSFSQVRRAITRNSHLMSSEQKKILVNALFELD